MSKEQYPGKLFVIEGPDGSGKTVQAKLLAGRLKKEGFPVKEISFPQYGEFFGHKAGEFLGGEFGKLEQVHPFLASHLYAADRWQAKDEIKDWLSKGIIALVNRYANSNMAHQAARVPEEKREAFWKLLEEMEFEVYGIPREDEVIFLNVPPEVSVRLLAERAKRDYLQDDKKDILETKEHLEEAHIVYLVLAERNNWIQIDCCDQSGELLSPEEIHELVYLALKDKLPKTTKPSPLL